MNMELPQKYNHIRSQDVMGDIEGLSEKVNEIIDYLDTHTSKEEIKSWAYTFIGNTANIRCGEEIKKVNIFQGNKRYEFTIPEELLELEKEV